MLKEFLQLKRDRLTFGMMVGIPIIQLFLFGFAMNADPRNLPVALIAMDQSEFTLSLERALTHTGYFAINYRVTSEAQAQDALAKGKVLFVLTIPSGFTDKLVKGERPALLLEGDATDPIVMDRALASINGVLQSVIKKDMNGALSKLQSTEPAFSIYQHRRYNPEGISQYNIVPGLVGVVLSMTMVLMTSLAITRERERGTMENLLVTPVRPLEIMSGKIVPYIFIGFIQVTLILLAAHWIFSIPFIGSVMLIYVVTLIFIAANLTAGITISSLVKNQLQAMQLTFFYSLPGVLLSGFIFPFWGMPVWAKMIGHALPMTYFNRVIRGILLKGKSWVELWPNIWPLILFTILVMVIGLKFYRKTLD